MYILYVILIIILLCIIYLYQKKYNIIKENFENNDNAIRTYYYLNNRDCVIDTNEKDISLGIIIGNQNDNNAYTPSINNKNNELYQNIYVYASKRAPIGGVLQLKDENYVGFYPNWKIINYQNNKKNIFLIKNIESNSYLSCGYMNGQTNIIYLQNKSDEKSLWMIEKLENGKYTIKHKVSNLYLYKINIASNSNNFISNVYNSPSQDQQFENKPELISYYEISASQEPYEWCINPYNHTQITNGSPYMWPGQSMRANDYLESENKKYTCILQSDGNICVKNKENNKNYYCLGFLYQGLINNGSASNSTLNFQLDTNLCLNKNGRNIWCLGNGFWQSNINEIYNKYNGHVPCILKNQIYIKLENDGNLTINYQNKYLWTMWEEKTPSNSNGNCSQGNQCKGYAPGNYCKGREQPSGDWGCNSYCNQKRGKHYRSDLGKCIQDLCAFPSVQSCSNDLYFGQCYSQCKNLGFTPPKIIKFNPYNKNGDCSNSNRCGNCTGYNSSAGNSIYCKSQCSRFSPGGYNWYRGDKGGCVKNFCMDANRNTCGLPYSRNSSQNIFNSYCPSPCCLRYKPASNLNPWMNNGTLKCDSSSGVDGGGVCWNRATPSQRGYKPTWAACPYQMPGNWRWDAQTDKYGVVRQCKPPCEGTPGYGTGIRYSPSYYLR